MIRNAKVDRNQKVIVESLRKFGAVVLHTHQLKNAFDILVGYDGGLFMMEIKVAIVLKTKENRVPKLSEGEEKCKDMFAKVNVPYYIVCSPEEAISVIKSKSK